MSNKVVTIYTLSDPDTKEIRYVGWTAKTLELRLIGHSRTKYRMLGMTSDWVARLRAAGKMPVISEVRTVTWDERFQAEKECIIEMVSRGHKLLNRAHNKKLRDRIV